MVIHPGGGSQSRPLGLLHGLPTGRPRRRPIGQPSLGIPARVGGRCRHPARRATLPRAEVLGTLPALVRTSPEETQRRGVCQALGRAGSPTGDPKLPRPRRERVAPSRSCHQGAKERGAPTRRPVEESWGARRRCRPVPGQYRGQAGAPLEWYKPRGGEEGGPVLKGTPLSIRSTSSNSVLNDVSRPRLLVGPPPPVSRAGAAFLAVPAHGHRGWRSHQWADRHRSQTRLLARRVNILRLPPSGGGNSREFSPGSWRGG